MNSNTNNPSIGQAQRVALLLIAFGLSALLFFIRGGINSQAPLDQLARNSLSPEVALSNGKPTIFEFYADWCEACRQMAPTILAIESQIDKQVDIVLLNIENNRWLDLIEKYGVSGIPQLNFFDDQGNFAGTAIGVQSEEKLRELTLALINHQELPMILNPGKVSNLEKTINQKIGSQSPTKNPKPRSHS
ncbi:thioredoxin domain-containing protein [Prochlorococcus sp. MIT 1307]|uniref:thioredoxin domain-containing protein n=1 Tax=Prochlorococcus sp. MIT 1307 TaxID=3096219 RepID=UPI002A748945|nr:thioredoxin domain-containing protein [Prochlorococcus sp. MIT 1307]